MSVHPLILFSVNIFLKRFRCLRAGCGMKLNFFENVLMKTLRKIFLKKFFVN